MFVQFRQKTFLKRQICHVDLTQRLFGTVWCFAEKWSMHVCANKHAHPTTASIDPCCRETHYITR